MARVNRKSTDQIFHRTPPSDNLSRDLNYFFVCEAAAFIGFVPLDRQLEQTDTFSYISFRLRANNCKGWKKLRTTDKSRWKSEKRRNRVEQDIARYYGIRIFDQQEFPCMTLLREFVSVYLRKKYSNVSAYEATTWWGHTYVFKYS